MSSNLSQPFGLRGALSSTLSNILLDLDQDTTTTTQFLQQQQHHQTIPRFAAPMPSISLPPTYASALSSPFGIASNPSRIAPGPGLLLAAAMANQQAQMVQTAKASLLQKQLLLEEQKQRILLAKQEQQQQQQQVAVTHNSAPTVAAAATVKPPKTPMAKEALQVLGRSLRKAADPYIDAAQLSQMSNTDDNKNANKQPRKARGGVTDPFPDKLHRMLSDGDNKHSDIVSFLPHGRAFYVHDMNRFVSQVMPQYFKQTKWTSFARQLSLYGFQRIHSGPDAGAYYHELFLRGRPQLVEHMRRVGVPQGQDRRKFRAQQKSKRVEPDFYAMKALE